MKDFVKNINEYNNVVQEWNDKYGSLTKGITVEVDDFCFGYIDKIRSILSKRMTGFQKVSITVKTVGDFNNIRSNVRVKKGSISRGELSNMVVRTGKDVLDSV